MQRHQRIRVYVWSKDPDRVDGFILDIAFNLLKNIHHHLDVEQGSRITVKGARRCSVDLTALLDRYHPDRQHNHEDPEKAAAMFRRVKVKLAF